MGRRHQKSLPGFRRGFAGTGQPTLCRGGLARRTHRCPRRASDWRPASGERPRCRQKRRSPRGHPRRARASAARSRASRLATRRSSSPWRCSSPDTKVRRRLAGARRSASPPPGRPPRNEPDPRGDRWCSRKARACRAPRRHRKSSDAARLRPLGARATKAAGKPARAARARAGGRISSGRTMAMVTPEWQTARFRLAPRRP